MSELPKPFPARFVLFAVSSGDDLAVEQAKQYVKDNGLTSDDVKIVRHKDDDGESVLVVTKKEVTLKT